MTRSTAPELNTAYAVVCVGWLMEDGLEVEPPLHAKLSVPATLLQPVLKSLTLPERQELKKGILKAATKGRMPGPLRVDELIVLLDSLGSAPSPERKGNGRMNTK